MKNRLRLFGWLGMFGIVALALVLAGPVGVLAQEEGGDSAAPGTIGFVGKNMVATAKGTFHSWKFTEVNFDWEALGDSVIELEVDVASLDTGIEKRDVHLRTADFFDVEQYPVATLRVYEIAKAGDGAYTAKLDWTMHGVSKTYEDFEFEAAGEGPVRVKGTFTVNRMDFKIGEPHSKLNPMSIKEEIPITFEAALPE